jgi:hypothetical protein
MSVETILVDGLSLATTGGPQASTRTERCAFRAARVRNILGIPSFRRRPRWSRWSRTTAPLSPSSTPPMPSSGSRRRSSPSASFLQSHPRRSRSSSPRRMGRQSETAGVSQQPAVGRAPRDSGIWSFRRRSAVSPSRSERGAAWRRSRQLCPRSGRAAPASARGARRSGRRSRPAVASARDLVERLPLPRESPAERASGQLGALDRKSGERSSSERALMRKPAEPLSFVLRI